MDNKQKVTPEFAGLYSQYKRDALYYEKCLRELRDSFIEGKGFVSAYKHPDVKPLKLLCSNVTDRIDDALLHTATPEGVDLEKPNYGMF